MQPTSNYETVSKPLPFQPTDVRPQVGGSHSGKTYLVCRELWCERYARPAVTVG